MSLGAIARRASMLKARQSAESRAARQRAESRALAAWEAWLRAEPGIERYHAEKFARARQLAFDRLVALQSFWGRGQRG